MMVSPASDNADAATLEEIVAYLDGELPPELLAQVEQRLATDEAYRQQLQSVDRAWRALDQLPQATVDDKFLRTTMELVVNEAQREVSERTQMLPTLRRRQRQTTWALAVVALAAGWLLLQVWRPDPNAELLADLAAIQNVDIYSQFREVEFLRALRGLDDLLMLPESVSGEGDMAALPLSLNASPTRRRAYLDQLPADQQANLRAKYNRFRSLPQAEQQRLRGLDAEIRTAADSPELQETLRRYQLWLASIPPARQFELRSLPNEQRLATIRRWAEEMQEEAALKLTPEQLQELAKVVLQPLPQLMRTLSERTPPDDRRPNGRDRFDSEFRRRAMLQILDGQGDGPAQEFYDRLLEALPDDVAKAFELLSPEKRVDRLQAWIRQATLLRGEISQEELERFFAEDLDAAVREELLLLPPGEMEAALRRLYHSQSGSPWGGWGRFPRGRERQPPDEGRGDGAGPWPGGPPGPPGPPDFPPFRPEGAPRPGLGPDGPPPRRGPEPPSLHSATDDAPR